MTELVTGVDIVREQLRIANGEPVVRPVDDSRPRHRVRLYAEDAANGFLPSIGPLAVFRPPEGPGIPWTRVFGRGRCHRRTTTRCWPNSSFGHLRPEALEKMRQALDEFVVLGTTTNIEFLRDLCDAKPVVDGTTTTTTIDDLWPDGWNPRQHHA